MLRGWQWGNLKTCASIYVPLFGRAGSPIVRQGRHPDGAMHKDTLDLAGSGSRWSSDVWLHGHSSAEHSHE